MPARTILTGEPRAALERLLAIAQHDTGQSRRVANFLLSWWNADDCGGFDLTDAWGVDRQIAVDMATVFAYVVVHCHYPDTLGYQKQFAALVRQWRPWMRRAPLTDFAPNLKGGI